MKNRFKLLVLSLIIGMVCIFNLDIYANVNEVAIYTENNNETEYENNINKVDIQIIKDCEYTGENIEPNIIATVDGKVLHKDTDYTLDYLKNINVGQATIIVKGIGDYSGTRETTFNIIPKDIMDLSVSDIANQPYTGKSIEPVITLKNGKINLENNIDYEVEYRNNIKLGIATIKIKGIGNYSGTKEASFKIVKNISEVTITGIKNKIYTGSKQKQGIVVKYGNKVLKDKKDYNVSYVNNVNRGTATAIITGKGDYAGTKEFTFKIDAKSITNLVFSKVKNYTYTGKVISPNISIKNGNITLVKSKDYDITYKNNTNAGSMDSVIISGLKSKVYTGDTQRQDVLVKYNNITLIYNKDYTRVYKNNINKGTATIVFRGKGNFTGTKTVTFKINAKNVNDLEYSKVKDYTYTGKAISPSITIKNGNKKLTKNTNYTISYKNNKNTGNAVITIKGKGNYTGTKEIKFKINKVNMSSTSIAGIKDKIYTGNKIKQAVNVTYKSLKLKDKVDYNVSYKNNVNTGTVTATISGKGNFTGSKSVTFKIKAKDIASLSFSKVLNRTYTGSEITPDVTIKNGSIKLVNGTDYTIKYSNNVKIGTATIIIMGKGNYTGTKKINFKIESKSYYIKVNYKANVVTIYTKGTSGKYDNPIKAMVCSTGIATPRSGKYGTKNKWSWLKMYGNVYGHYVTQITGDILFHSVPYLKKSIDTLEYWEYDKLGTSASLGCVRLTAEDAKWIYDNIPRGTTVEFYSSNNPGPLGKPKAMKISEYKEYRNWDPTDPSSKNPWRKIL